MLLRTVHVHPPESLLFSSLLCSPPEPQTSFAGCKRRSWCIVHIPVACGISGQLGPNYKHFIWLSKSYLIWGHLCRSGAGWRPLCRMLGGPQEVLAPVPRNPQETSD